MSKSNNNLIIDLKKQPDRNGKIFYVGKLKFPGNIKCDNGVAFLVFVSETGVEQLQIASMEKMDKIEKIDRED
jgi:hypothetical protein